MLPGRKVAMGGTFRVNFVEPWLMGQITWLWKFLKLKEHRDVGEAGHGLCPRLLKGFMARRKQADVTH